MAVILTVLQLSAWAYDKLYDKDLSEKNNELRNDLRNELKMDNNNYQVIARLKFICKIKPGVKINSKHLYMQEPGIVTKISRTVWRHDTRRSGLTFIKSTIYDSFNIVNSCINSEKLSEKELAKNTVIDICNCRANINNYKTTYASDDMFVSEIETLLSDINSKLAEIKEKYPEIFDELKKNK